MLWFLGDKMVRRLDLGQDKMVPRLDLGQVGQSGDLSLAECMLSDKRRFTSIVKEIT
jgi:hypothetical protein